MLSTFNPALREQLSGLTNNLFHAGMSPPTPAIKL